jgi:hypothetical protein
MKTYLLYTFCIALATTAQQVAKNITAANGQLIGFYQFNPYDYNTNSNTYPLIIFLHGVGERGNGTTELSRVLSNALPRYCANGATMKFTYGGKPYSFLVLSPQLSASYGNWQDFYTEEMIAYAKKNLRVDTNRIYLCGLSLGGGGVWKYATSSAAAANQLAAIAPTCGTGEGTTFCHIAKNKMAVWGFHALDDYTVASGNTSYAINQINNCQPQIIPKATYYTTGGHGIWDRALDTGHTFQNPNVYEWMLSYSKHLDAPINLPPIAYAGNDKIIVLPTNSITVDASLSYDQDATPIQYQWIQIAGPANAIITNASNAMTNISNLIPGNYTFRVTITDMQGATAFDEVSITVHPAIGYNAPPIAVAGNNSTITGNFYVCNSWGSIDPDGMIATYRWKKISGPAQGSIQDTAVAYANVYNLTSGTYQFQLEVKDNVGANATDTVQVVVDLAGINLLPVANAGVDQTIATNYTVINGSTSADPDGALTYEWQQLGGPSGATITNNTSAITAINNLISGTYQFRLSAKDNQGAIATDDIFVTVQNNVLPVHFLYVTATRTIVGNTLKWATTNNGLNDYFEIERSLNGIQFQVIGTIKNQMAATANEVYNFTDATASYDTKIFYRIKQVDKDGVITFSATQILYNNSSTSTPIIYPNPVKDYLKVAMSNSIQGKGHIVVHDATGKIVWQNDFTKDQNNFSIGIDASPLPKGWYVVKVNIGGAYSSVQKVIKE